MTSVIRILIADEYPIFCQGVKETLASNQEICLVACVTCHSQLPATCQECQPDTLLLSGNVVTTWHLETGLSENPLSAKVIGLLTKPEDASLHWFLQHGATGLFLKSDPPEKLVEAIFAINQGERWISTGLLPGFMGNPLDKPGRDLSEQDLAVLRLMAADKTNQEIAGILHMSRRTVGNHLSKIYASLDVETRSGAVAQAFRLKLIE